MRAPSNPPRRIEPRALLPGLLFACPVLGGCASDALARVDARNVPLREASLEPWRGRSIGDRSAEQYLLERTAIVIGGAELALSFSMPIAFPHQVFLGGEPVESFTCGAAVAVSADGYYLTALHAIDPPPYALLLERADGSVVSTAGRTVWDGSEEPVPVDLALVHVPRVETHFVPWCDPEDIRPGIELLACGSGAQGGRLVGGHLLQAPDTCEEAAPGHAHVLAVSTPLVRGDSGGPVILANGRLLGIQTSVRYTRLGRFDFAIVQRPDPAFIQALIEEDRRLHPPQPPVRFSSQCDPCPHTHAGESSATGPDPGPSTGATSSP